MQSDIFKYINNEKDIARCRVSILEKLSDPKPSKKRILDMERDFINFRFEDMNFASIEDVDNSIVLYRTYKTYFFIKYSEKIPIAKIPMTKKDVYLKIKKKYLFLNYLVENITDDIIKINIYDDQIEYFNYKKICNNKNISALSKAELGSLSISRLRRVEPSSVSKDRARRQALTLSFALYLNDFLAHLNNEMGLGVITSSVFDYKNKNILYLLEILYFLDSVFKNISNDIFKNYNKSIEMLAAITEGSRGEKKSFNKIYKLIDIFSPCNDNKHFPILIPGTGHLIDSFKISKLKNKKIINLGIKKDKRDSYNSKVHGILFPIKRTGNEKMSIFYLSIYHKDVDITNLFCDKFSNILGRCDDEEECYFKCLMIKEIYNNIEFIMSSDPLLSIYQRILGVSDIVLKESFSDLYLKDFINNYNFKGVGINNNISSALVSRTRTDNDSLERAKKIVLDEVKVIDSKYSNI